MPSPPRRITAFLELEARGRDVWEAPIPAYTDRSTLFGGQVAAQALRAAALTVEPGLHPSSMHAHYLAPGSRTDMLIMAVERLRDGRSFANRRIEAIQDGRLVLTMEATFHLAEEGPDRSVPMPPDPGPEVMPEQAAPAGGLPDVPMEVRSPDPMSIPSASRLALWTRSLESWPEDSSLAACLLAYVADMRTGYASVSGLATWDGGMLTSLDHSVWFHRHIDPSDWMLVDMQPLANADARGLVLGTIHDRRGRHAATFAQEVLNRPRPRP
jgi:acyl-CoA thioesterase-2